MACPVWQLFENYASVLCFGEIFLFCFVSFFFKITFQPLRRALIRMGAPGNLASSLVPETLDSTLSISALQYLRKIKNQAKEEFERSFCVFPEEIFSIVLSFFFFTGFVMKSVAVKITKLCLKVCV